ASNANIKSHIQKILCHLPGIGITVYHTSGLFCMGCFHHIIGIFCRFSAVYDHRKFHIFCKFHLCLEPFFLDPAVWFFPVIIQPDFSDCHNLITLTQFFQFFYIFCCHPFCFTWMHSNRSIHHRIPADCFCCPSGTFHIGSHIHN